MRAVAHSALCLLQCPITKQFGSKTRENGIRINSRINRLLDVLQSRLWNGHRQISNCIYKQYLLFMQPLYIVYLKTISPFRGTDNSKFFKKPSEIDEQLSLIFFKQGASLEICA